MLHGLCCGEEAGARNLVFPCKVAAGGDERYLVCAAVAAAVGLPFFFAAVERWLQAALAVLVCA